MGLKSTISICLASEVYLVSFGDKLVNDSQGNCGQYVVGIKLAGVEYDRYLISSDRILSN